MTSRERVVRSIRFEGPDRVPVLHRIKPGYFRLHGESIRALQKCYPPDILQSPTTHTWFTFHSPGKLSTEAGALVRDEWGCVWKNLSSDYLGQVVDSPLKSWSDLAAYRFPDPAYGSEGLEEMDEVRRADGGRHYLLAWVGSLFHLYTYLRGYEEALIDVAEESTGYFQLLDRITEFLAARIRLLGRRGVDGILISDDWGTQLDVLINPETWRRVFQPRYRRILEEMHRAGALAHFHTCGHTLPILPELIDCGFDEINPQVPTMDIQRLRPLFLDRVCIRPDLDRQQTLVSGTPEEVRRHVEETFAAFRSRRGGYIGHIPIEMNVSPQNAEAMMRAYREARFADS
jgi:uroporphyrinogen-III decarboxylase